MGHANQLWERIHSRAVGTADKALLNAPPIANEFDPQEIQGLRERVVDGCIEGRLQ